MPADRIVDRSSLATGGLCSRSDCGATTRSSEGKARRCPAHFQARPARTTDGGGAVCAGGIDLRETVCAVTRVVNLVSIEWTASLNISHDDCWLLYLVEDWREHCTEDAIAKGWFRLPENNEIVVRYEIDDFSLR